jgi:predicted  nucleic acid-binding Zn-ribbon protein
MGATLEALHRLQVIESQLRSVREQIESKRRSVQGSQRRIATIDRQLADTHEQIRNAQAEADKLELDRKTNEAHIAKLREALNRSKTNKEYAAVLTQLNTDKADLVKLEDAVLAAMSKVDELKKQEAQLREGREKEVARAAELTRAAEEVEARLSAQIKDLESQREAATGGIRDGRHRAVASQAARVHLQRLQHEPDARDGERAPVARRGAAVPHLLAHPLHRRTGARRALRPLV